MSNEPGLDETQSADLRPSRHFRSHMGAGITAVQSICSERSIPALVVTGSLGEIRTRIPAHVLVEKPISAGHIVDATRLALDRRDG